MEFMYKMESILCFPEAFPLNVLLTLQVFEKPIGVIALIMKDNYPEFLPIHWVINRKQLPSKYFKYVYVMKTVLMKVNLIFPVQIPNAIS